MASVPTGQEKQYYDQLFDAACKDDVRQVVAEA